MGNATYYSDKAIGRSMANGQPYAKDSLTCAHRTLPFNTRIKVYNPQNGKSVVVRVTDRGPYSKKLIIDLSYAAAKELEIIQQGICPVELTILTTKQ